MPSSNDHNKGTPYRHIASGSLLSRAKKIYNKYGLNCFIHISIRYVIEMFFVSIPNYIKLRYYKKFRSTDTFEFNGKKYHYLFHAYCPTWKNERAAVLPIIWDIVKKTQEQGKNVLEVGNLLSYVYPVTHDVLDKYEIVEGVINEDVVNFQPSKQYDLIFSVLTLSWVGLKEVPSDPMKFLPAIENLKSILRVGGVMIIIHGMGFNLEMDKAISNGTLKFSKQYFIKKIGGCEWKQVTWNEIKNLSYDYSIETARGVIIGIIEK